MMAARTEASSGAPLTATVFESRSTSTPVTPATLPTSLEIACAQCAQLIPGTLYVKLVHVPPLPADATHGGIP